MKDFVIPNGNEKDFVLKAELLGFKELMLLYPLARFESVDLARIQAMTKIKLSKGILARGDIAAANKKGFTAVEVDEDTDIRMVLQSRPDLVFGSEAASKKDYLHHRGSGFNQVLVKIAKEKGVLLGFSFSSVLNADAVLRSQIIGRMSQNKRLFAKYKVKYLVASFAKAPNEMRAAKDLEAFGRVL